MCVVQQYLLLRCSSNLSIFYAVSFNGSAGGNDILWAYDSTALWASNGILQQLADGGSVCAVAV